MSTQLLYIFFIPLFLCSTLCSTVSAQETQSVTLVEVLEMAGSTSLRIQEFEQRKELTLANVERAKEWYLPTLYGGLSTHFLGGSAMNGDGRFFTDVSRSNLWGGIGFDAEWDFGKGIFTSQAANARVAGAGYAVDAARNQTLLAVSVTYLDLQAARVTDFTLGKLLTQTERLIKQIQVQVEGGLAYPSELLLAKANHNHHRIRQMEAQENAARYANQLSALLNIREDKEWIISDTAIRPMMLLDMETAEAISTWESHTQRPEFKGMENAITALELERKTVTKGLALPTLRVGGYGSMFGDVFTPLYPTAEVNLSLLWDLPLGRLVKKGEVLQVNSQISLQQNLIEQFRDQVSQEISQSRLAWSSAKTRMEVSLEGMDFARKALDQSMQRQRLRTARPYEVFQAQEYFIQAKLDFIKAVSEYNKAQYRLFVAAGNSL